MESSVQTEYVTYASDAGGVRAYLARPADTEADGFAAWPGDAPSPGPLRGPASPARGEANTPSPLAGEGWGEGGLPRRPALVVIHEWTGLIPYVEDVCRRLAREGYLTLAPDLYSGDPLRAAMAVDDLEAATELGRAPTVEEGLRAIRAERRDAVLRAHEWRQARTGDKYVPFLQGTLAHLQERPDVNPSAIGVIGFCMGGRLASTLAATGVELAAAVSFYGPNPPLGDVPNIRCPIQGHYGSEDPSVTLKVPALEAAMMDAGKEFTYFVYKGAAHGFHNDTRPDYHAEAARIAWERALDFLHRHVRNAVPSA